MRWCGCVEGGGEGARGIQDFEKMGVPDCPDM